MERSRAAFSLSKVHVVTFERFRLPHKIDKEGAKGMSGSGDFEETERETSEKPRGAIRTEPRHLNDQESLAQAA